MTTRRLTTVFALLVALTWTVAATPRLAYAQGDAPPADEAEPEVSEFDKLVMAAAEAYGDRDYAGALELFEQAYALDPVADLLYNMGVIADKLGDFDAALTYLNQFVVSPGVDIDAREDALKRIEQLKQLKALSEPEPQPDPDPVPAPEPEPAPIIADPVVDEPDYVGPGIVLGLGLVTLAGGGVTGGIALMKHSDFEEATSVDARRDAADSGETLALVSDILIPTGAALATAGIIWLAIEATSGPDEPDALGAVQVAPSVSHEGLGMHLKVDF